MQRYFKLRPSRLFALLLALLYLTALLSLWLVPLPVVVALGLSAALSYGVIRHLACDAQLADLRSCVAIRLEEGDGVVLILRNGDHLPGRLSRDSLVTPLVVILNVALSGSRGRRSIRALPDSMGRDGFRRLRVALRWLDGGSQAAVKPGGSSTVGTASGSVSG